MTWIRSKFFPGENPGWYKSQIFFKTDLRHFLPDLDVIYLGIIFRRSGSSEDYDTGSGNGTRIWEVSEKCLIPFEFLQTLEMGECKGQCKWSG